jgi:hypothetical protein
MEEEHSVLPTEVQYIFLFILFLSPVAPSGAQDIRETLVSLQFLDF